MDPLQILQQEWCDQLIATLRVLHGDQPIGNQDLAIHHACQALRLWLEAIPDAPPPLVRKRKAA